MRKGEYIPTTRADGTPVGLEVTKQRRHQLRNREALAKIQSAYKKTEKGRASRRKHYLAHREEILKKAAIKRNSA